MWHGFCFTEKALPNKKEHDHENWQILYNLGCGGNAARHGAGR
jgi:hypothetical protein